MTKQEIIEYIEDLGFTADMLDLYEDSSETLFIVARGALPMHLVGESPRLIGHVLKGKVTYYE